MAQRRQLVIDQGATFSLKVRYLDDEGNPIDITGYKARLQLRETVESETPVLDLNSDDDPEEISITAAAGEIDLSLKPATSMSLLAMTYVYDLEIYTTGDQVVRRILEGKAVVRRNTTR